MNKYIQDAPKQLFAWHKLPNGETIRVQQLKIVDAATAYAPSRWRVRDINNGYYYIVSSEELH